MKLEYKREILYSDDNCDVVLCTWPPGAKSLCHDHGEATGVIRIIEGSLYQDVYTKETKKFIKKDIFMKDETFIETPELIHTMGNASDTEVAKTLHLYTPKLKMNNYNIGK